MEKKKETVSEAHSKQIEILPKAETSARKKENKKRVMVQKGEGRLDTSDTVFRKDLSQEMLYMRLGDKLSPRSRRPY